MKNTILACVYALLSLCVVVQGKPNCAVATFEARGTVTADDATTLSDWLESELIELNQFSMVARTQMAKIVDAQEMSMSCDSADSAIELGKLLSARYIVFGSASKVGSTYVLIATLADVETAELIRTARFEQTGPIDDLLKTGIPSIARKLASLDTKDEVVQETSSSDSPSWFKKNWPWLAGGAAVVVGGVALAGGGGGSSDDSATSSVTGIWRGEAGTGGVPTILSLNQNGNAISGNCTWWGRTVGCSGSVSGDRVTLFVEQDQWGLTLGNNTLNGVGIKGQGGSSYLVRLTKQ